MQIHPLIRRRLPFAVLLALTALIAWFAATGPRADQPRLPQQDLAFIAPDGTRHLFTVEVARSDADLQLGLMNRRHLDADKGMLFWFGLPERIVSFWMKDTFIPLDMVFIDAGGKVTGVHESAQPQDLTPIRSEVPVVAVLEIGGGQAAKQGIAAGDTVDFPGLPATAAPAENAAAPMTPVPASP